MKDFKQELREKIEEIEGVTIQNFENGVIEVSVYDTNKDILKQVCKKKVIDVIDNLKFPFYENFKFKENGRIETERRGVVAYTYEIITPFTEEEISEINKDRAEAEQYEIMEDKIRCL